MYTIGVVLTVFAVCWFLFVQFMLDMCNLCDTPTWSERLFCPFSWVSYVFLAIGVVLIHFSP